MWTVESLEQILLIQFAPFNMMHVSALVQDRKEGRGVVGKALQFWLNRQLSTAWQAWRHYQLWCRNMRQAAAAIITRMQNKSLLVGYECLLVGFECHTCHTVGHGCNKLAYGRSWVRVGG